MRNRDPILAVLRRVLPPEGSVLEIAAGSGEHAVHFAKNLPGVRWRPSDAEPEAVASIAAWRIAEGPPNLLVPLTIDVRSEAWPVERFDAVFCANMIHIAPWDACLGLLDGAARHLVADGLVVLYGPFHVGGRATAPSNDAFDADLRRRNADWGVRHLEDVVAAAGQRGFFLVETVAMPANNLTVLLRHP